MKITDGKVTGGTSNTVKGNVYKYNGSLFIQAIAISYGISPDPTNSGSNGTWTYFGRIQQ